MTRRFRLVTHIVLMFALLAVAICPQSVVGFFVGRVIVEDNGAYLGHYATGAKVTHNFDIRNISIRNQRIGRIEPSCTCSVGSVSSYDIAPFSKATIKLVVDTSRLPAGKMTKALRVVMMDGTVLDPAYVSFTVEARAKR